MTPAEGELLPCPFCGTAEGFTLADDGAHECNGCGAFGPCSWSGKNWNTRSTLADENAMLRDAAERGLEWVIEAANERKQKDAVFDNAMRDIARIEAALSHKETNRHG